MLSLHHVVSVTSWKSFQFVERLDVKLFLSRLYTWLRAGGGMCMSLTVCILSDACKYMCVRLNQNRKGFLAD